MHFGTSIENSGVREDVVRPGFPDRYREVAFTLVSDGIPPIEARIWVHEAWPAEEVETVARSFLAGRLADMAAVAARGTYAPEDLDRLWRQVRSG